MSFFGVTGGDADQLLMEKTRAEENKYRNCKKSWGSKTWIWKQKERKRETRETSPRGIIFPQHPKELCCLSYLIIQVSEEIWSYQLQHPPPPQKNTSQSKPPAFSPKVRWITFWTSLIHRIHGTGILTYSYYNKSTIHVPKCSIYGIFTCN